MTRNELKDVALLLIAHFYLSQDMSRDLGLYIDEEATSQVERLAANLSLVVQEYAPHKQRVNNLVDALFNRLDVDKSNYTSTAIQLACEILRITLAPNERGNLKIAKPLEDFYNNNKGKITLLIDRSYDTKYEDEAVDAFNLAYKYVQEMRQL